MNKKSIMMKFFLTLILALIFFVPAILFASQFFRLSDKAMDSFNKLAKLIEEVKSGELQSMPLYMDKNTAIMGFAKESKAVEIKYEGTGSMYETTPLDSYFERPKICMNNKACLCLCRSGLKFKRNSQKIICEKELFCKQIDNIDFPSEIKNDNFLEYTYDFTLIGGFMIKRGSKGSLYQAQISMPTITKRLVDIKVQRHNNYIGVCFTNKCIPDDVKG
jgi:hypothetical protein